MSQVEKATATQFSVSGKNYAHEVSFNNDKGQWQQKVDPTNPFKANSKKVGAILDALTLGRATDFVSPIPKNGTDEIRLKIGDAKSPEKFNYRFFKVKDQAYGQDLNSKRLEAYLLDVSIKNALPFHEDSWKMK
jgi:hypothetical protein